MTRLAFHRRRLLGAALLAAVGLTLRVSPGDAAADAPGGASDAPGGGDAAPVVAPIQQLCDGLLAIMRAGQSVPFAQRFNQLAPEVDSAFDMDTILRVSVGPSWPTLPPDQQAMLEAAFRRYTIASYVNSFDEYSGQRFEVSPQVRALPNGEQVVDTRIVPRSGDPHELAYVMRETSQGWRAVDVLLDGTISRVAVQRSDFRNLLLHGGAAALAKSLQEKTANLSGGTA